MGSGTVSKRLGGFDALRVLAAAIVMVSHTCALTDNDEYISVNGMSLGRMGTAIFFALSGFMAAVSARSPEAWLWLRLRKIYPAFWIVMAVSFVGAWATDYKPFDWLQVVCQFAGIGLFTHYGDLVNIVTWFVSLILLLYWIVYLARRTHEAVILGSSVVVAAGLAMALPTKDAVVPCHALTFLFTYILARLSQWTTSLLLLFIVAHLSLSLVEPMVLYGLCAIMLTSIASHGSFEWKLGQLFARYSYEWFLVHGLCLHLVLRFLGDHFLVALLTAGVLSLAVAILVQRTVLLLRTVLNGVSTTQASVREATTSSIDRFPRIRS